MRRKVTCTASTHAGTATALLIAQLDLADLVVVDAPYDLASDLIGAAAAQGYEPRVQAGGWADAAGSDVVVLDTVGDALAEELAERCAGAIVVVATGAAVPDVERLLAGTHLPRARVFGLGAEAGGPLTTAARAAEVVDAILRDRGRTLSCAVQCRGEDGDDHGVRVRDVRVGAAGVIEIL